MPNADGSMTAAEIAAYEAEVVRLRADKPPPNPDLPPISGVFALVLPDDFFALGG